MIMRKKIVAGNWKMNPLPKEAYALIDDLANGVNREQFECEVWIAPPAVYLENALSRLKEYSVAVGVQNIYPESTGAYTGEISAEMAGQMGAQFVLVGHSERRNYFRESNEFLMRKMEHVSESGLKAVYCCGENLEERESGNHFEVVKKQLEEVVLKLNHVDPMKVVIAYEPVWAIGTGKTATPDQAQEMHAFIRETIAATDADTASNISILYGGSCKPGNAAELFSRTDVDGGLIGGASLVAEDFFSIAKSF